MDVGVDILRHDAVVVTTFQYALASFRWRGFRLEETGRHDVNFQFPNYCLSVLAYVERGPG